jgi:hypothetical protein
MTFFDGILIGLLLGVIAGSIVGYADCYYTARRHAEKEKRP